MESPLGAHPSSEDREHCGRRPLSLPQEEIATLVERQSRLVLRLAAEQEVRLQHMSNHTLHSTICLRSTRKWPQEVVEGVVRLGTGIVLVGLAESRLIAEARRRNVPCWQEFFADRQYRSDGTLVPRTEANAVIQDEEVAAERVIRAILTGKVRSVEGGDCSLHVDTVCIHGDTPGAPRIAKRLRTKLSQAGIQIRADAQMR